MQRYIIVRMGQAIITLFIISVVVFSLTRLSGDPINVLVSDEADEQRIQQVRELWGLDRPLYIQYLSFVKNGLSGNFGESLAYKGYSAMGLVKERLPATLQLAGLSLAIAIGLALPIGVLSAVKKDTSFDYATKIFGLLGQSLPQFWLGIIFIWVFGVMLGWLPTCCKGGFSHIILPALALGYYQVAALMRLTRSSMLEVLDAEYVKMAHVKGLPRWKILWKHCLRNAAIGPLTYLGIIVGILFTGAVAIETVFAWPGLGLLAVQSVQTRDFTVVQTIALVGAALVIAISLLIDIAYAYLDPRIRYT